MSTLSKIWSSEEEAVLIENYPHKTITELMEILPYSDSQIRNKAKKLKLERKSESYKIDIWTKDEEELLVNNYQSHTVKELMKLLPRFNEQQIRNKAFKLKLKKTNNWTEELEEYLKANYQHMSIEDMINDKLINFTETGVYKKLNSLGLRLSNRIKWTDKDIKTLEKFYPIRTNEEMSDLLPQFTVSQIKSKASYLGIKKSDLLQYKSRMTGNIENKWSDHEKKVLIEYYANTPLKMIQEKYLPNRSIDAIKKQASRLGIQSRLTKNFIWKNTNVELVDNARFTIKVTYRKEQDEDA